MILLTHMDGRSFVVNAEMIKLIESTPDTLLTLINGECIRVREGVQDVVARAVDYQRQIHGFSVV